jgi:hypothetical protein
MRICSILLLLPAALLYAQAPAGALDGDVVNSVTGAPVASARVKLTGGKSDPRYSTADARGHFHFDNVSGASHTLFVQHPGYLPADSIPVGAAPSTVKVSLTQGAIVYGAVTDPNGFPASTGALIGRIFDPRPIDPRSPHGPQLPDGKSALFPVSGMLIDDHGQYRSSLLAPGVYYVAVLSQHANFWERTWRSTYYPHALDVASAKPISLAPGQQVRADIQMMRQTGVHVSGRVAVPAYDPPPPGMQSFTFVHLVSRSGSLGNSDATSSPVTADRFEASDLLPGTYTVVAETRQVSTDGMGRKSKVLFGARRQLEIGDRDISDLDLQLQPLPEVTGRVTFADGCAAAPVRVLLSSSSIGGIQDYSALAGPDGAFAFSTFLPGSLVISAAGPGPATVFLGDRDITKSGFDYPTPTPQELRVAISCASGGAQ